MRKIPNDLSKEITDQFSMKFIWKFPTLSTKKLLNQGMSTEICEWFQKKITEEFAKYITNDF